MIRIGVSGWSHELWRRGVFYPADFKGSAIDELPSVTLP